MINVSSEFKQLMESRTDFLTNAVITLSDGTEIILSESDFVANGNMITDGAGTGGFPLGVAVARTVRLEIFNDDDRFTSVDFRGAKINVTLKFQLSKTAEYIEFGVFTVIDPATSGETITITAIDAMSRADVPYTSGVKYPASLETVFIDVCDQCGLPYETSIFRHSEYEIAAAPSIDVTCRDMLSYIAMIACGNARVSRSGNVEIIPWEFLDAPSNTAIDGGSFNPWTTGDDIDGGDFEPWTAGDDVNGGVFDPWVDESDTVVIGDADHTIRSWNSLDVDVNDITITGVQTKGTISDSKGSESDITYLYGDEGYVISFSNPLIAGDEQNVLTLLGDLLIGAVFRKFSGAHTAYPLAEFMDTVAFYDRKGRAYTSVLTDIEFVFLGETQLTNAAESGVRTGSAYTAPETKVLVKARDLVFAERTEREEAVSAESKAREEAISEERQEREKAIDAERKAREEATAKLQNALDNTSGFYFTDEVQPDGSTIRYQHDKPKLKDSANVTKITASAIGYSSDGGKTYPYGVTVDGETIMRIVSAEGINADWITTGSVNADLITTGSINADLITSGSINANLIKTGAINADLIKTGSINANLITTGTLSADRINSGVIRSTSGASYFSLDTGNLQIGGTLYYTKIESGALAQYLSKTSGFVGGLVPTGTETEFWETLYYNAAADKCKGVRVAAISDGVNYPPIALFSLPEIVLYMNVTAKKAIDCADGYSLNGHKCLHTDAAGRIALGNANKGLFMDGDGVGVTASSGNMTLQSSSGSLTCNAKSGFFNVDAATICLGAPNTGLADYKVLISGKTYADGDVLSTKSITANGTSGYYLGSDKCLYVDSTGRFALGKADKKLFLYGDGVGITASTGSLDLKASVLNLTLTASSASIICQAAEVFWADAQSITLGTVGTTVSGYKIYLGGYTHVDGGLNVLNNAYVGTELSAASITNRSDRRIKTNIVNTATAGALDSVCGLALYDYDLTGGKGSVKMGLMADEAPLEILSGDGKGINLYSYCGLLAMAIRELAQKIK